MMMTASLPLPEDLLYDEGPWAEELGALGYPGFAYMAAAEAPDASRFRMKALDSANLDPRVAEGLPWVLANLDLNWEWLLETAKEHNHRNRLGFLLDLAVDFVKAKGNSERAATLELHLADLEMMRSDQQDTFCQESMSEVRRRHVLARRSKTAEHWNLVTDFSLAYLDQAFE